MGHSTKTKKKQAPTGLKLTLWNLKQRMTDDDEELYRTMLVPLAVKLEAASHSNLAELARFTYVSTDDLATELLTAAIQDAMRDLNIYAAGLSGPSSGPFVGYEVRRLWELRQPKKQKDKPKRE
jgi:hypothetical protein